ncbi:MAG: hypothetical protein ACFBWO_13465 [Paracoccaceae bacterium]
MNTPKMPGAREALDAMPKPAREAFETWISFFPTAPLFGVDWRFAPGAGANATSRPASGDTRPVARSETSPPKTPGDAAPLEQPVEVARESVEAGQEATVSAMRATGEAAASAREMAERTAETMAERSVDTVGSAGEAATSGSKAGAKAAKGETKAAADEAKGAAKAGGEAAKKATDAGAEGAKRAADLAKPSNLYKKAPDAPDDLKLIRGVGPALEKQLNGLGVYHFSQIADMTEANLAWIDDNLTAFKGRCFRDDWVGQARQHRG